MRRVLPMLAALLATGACAVTAGPDSSVRVATTASRQTSDRVPARAATVEGQVRASPGRSGPARTYHVDAVRGDDANAGDPATPWKTLARIAKTRLGAGDSVLLRCGQVWRETLVLDASIVEASGAVRIGGYGDDCSRSVRPEINSADVVTGWQAVSGRVIAAAVPAPVGQVHVGGAFAGLARHPNAGFLPIAEGGSGTPASEKRILRSPDLVPVSGKRFETARAQIRTVTWAIETVPVDGVGATGVLSLSRPTRYPLAPGYGFYLENELWMLDRPGEWYFDPKESRLYLWPIEDGSDRIAAVEATRREHGILLEGLDGVSIVGLRIRHSAEEAVLVRNSPRTELRDVEIVDAGLDGMRLENSPGSTVADSAIQGSGRDAVVLVRSPNSRVTGNALVDTAMRGSPRPHFAVINGTDSDDLVIDRNTIRNSGYIGIRFKRRTQVTRNVIDGFCKLLDDGGAIHAWAAVDPKPGFNSVVEDNILTDGPGNEGGRRPGPGQTVGIYLDDLVSGIQVRRNTASGAMYGLLLHGTADIVAENNVFFGNRKNQIILTDINIKDHESMQRNLVRGNVVATTDGGLPFYVEAMGGRADLGTFEGNRIVNALTDDVVRVNVKTKDGNKARTYAFGEWQRSGMERDGRLVRRVPFAPDSRERSVADGDILPNGGFVGGLAGWQTWAKDNLLAAELVSSCDAGTPCVALDYRGADRGVFSSGRFELKKGASYVLSVRVKADRAGDARADLAVRRSQTPYDILGANLSITVSDRWRDVTVPFDAKDSTPDARVDVVVFSGGPRISVGAVSVRRVNKGDDGPFAQPRLLTNASAEPAVVACPDANSRRCALYETLDGKRVAWPITLPAFGSAVVLLGPEGP